MDSTTGHRETEPTLEEQIAQIGKIQRWEEFWRDHQPWLERQGYMLRPRYRPNWKPSWEGTDALPGDVEDGITPLVRYASLKAVLAIYHSKHSHILDATRMSDGKIVTLKRINKEVHPYEVEITRYFSVQPLASHPRNHCVPLYDVLDVPDEDNMALLVLPFLRSYNSPSFRTVGETIDFFTQIFEVTEISLSVSVQDLLGMFTGFTVYAPMSCRPSVRYNMGFCMLRAKQ